MVPSTSFLTIPREVRNLIYQEYFTVKGGYVLDFESRKLKAADGSCLDLGLISTCRLIAQETGSIPLAINTITFCTIYSDDLRLTAGFFDHLLDDLRWLKNRIFLESKRFINPDIYANAISKFPTLKPVLDRILIQDDVMDYNYHNHFPWGPAPSVHREGITYILRLLANHHGMDFLGEDHITPWAQKDVLQLVDLGHTPWAIPSQNEIDRIVDVLKRPQCNDWHNLFAGYDRLKYRISAAAAAIYFLESISDRVRQYIRNIVVHEDRYAVPSQSCHAQGLIPFCKENPHLRIEHRVSLWRTIFPSETIDRWNIGGETQASHGTFGTLWCFYITRSVGNWLDDGMAVLHLGMPPDSMTLVLDGDPLPELCEVMFQKAIQREVVWQLAFDETHSQNPNFPPNPWKRVRFCSELFPTAVRHLVNESSIFRCNFNPGRLLDVESLVDEHRGWSIDHWLDQYDRLDEEEFHTIPPLPKWHNLVLENFLTKKEMKRRIEMGRL